MKINLFNLFIASFIVIISCSDVELIEKEKEADNLIYTFIKENKIPGLSVTILNGDGYIECDNDGSEWLKAKGSVS